MSSSSHEWLNELYLSSSGTGSHSLHHAARHLLSSTRVAGVGTAVFVFFFFLAFCLLLCIVGVRSNNRGSIFALSGLILLLVFIILYASPKGPPVEAPPQGYDHTIIWLWLLLVVICLGAILGCVGVLVFHLGTAFYAKPLSRRDVEITY